MRITVKNFGPIRGARNVRVGPMTIFVGPSNTGKSYLATLIYSVVKALRDDKFRFWPDKHGYVDLDDLDITEPLDGVDITDPDVYKNQKQMLIQVDEYFNTWCRVVNSSWMEQVTYCFGEEVKNLIEKEITGVQISESSGKVILDLMVPSKSKLPRVHKLELLHLLQKELHALRGRRREFYGVDGEVEKRQSRLMMESLVNDISDDHFSKCLLEEDSHHSHHKSYYLPAIRGGLMQSHRTLVSALIQRAPMAGVNRISSIAPFTGILSDFMEKLINVEGGSISLSSHDLFSMEEKRTSRKEITKIGRNMEKTIMDGKINVEMSETNYPDFRYEFKRNNKKHDLPLMSVSSMVSELAPVSLFLRRHVSPGDLLMLEEPEAHLHPAAQLEISKTLVELVNADVQVLITTHSDHILEKIGNCMLEFNVQKIKESDTTKDNISLDEKKAFIYFFDKPMTGKQQNTTVKNIPFHPDTGILTKDHLDVSSALYNQTVDLYNQSIDYYDQPTESLGEKENDDD